MPLQHFLLKQPAAVLVFGLRALVILVSLPNLGLRIWKCVSGICSELSLGRQTRKCVRVQHCADGIRQSREWVSRRVSRRLVTTIAVAV